MTAARQARILALLASVDVGQPLPHRVCTAAVAALPVSGAGLRLMGTSGHQILVHGTDSTARQLEDLQLTLGVGPCVESVRRGGPVLVPDLARQSAGRWPGFVEPALGAGVRAIFAFPLQIGAIGLGVLDLYRNSIGGLNDDAMTDALIFLDVVTLALLDTPVAGTDGDGILTTWMGDADTAVHQATGMIMVQLGVPIDQAMLRLRAYAFAHDRTITATARDLVARRLRLEPEP